MRALLIRKFGGVVRDYEVPDDMTMIRLHEIAPSVALLSPKNINESLDMPISFKLIERLNTYDKIAIFREVY